MSKKYYRQAWYVQSIFESNIVVSIRTDQYWRAIDLFESGCNYFVIVVLLTDQQYLLPCVDLEDAEDAMIDLTTVTLVKSKQILNKQELIDSLFNLN